MNLNEKTSKILSIAVKVITYIITAFAIFMMIFTIVTVSTVGKNDRHIFGTRFYIVRTDSMSKSENNADMDVHFNAGDIILVKNVKDAKALEAGDIISFMSTNSDSYGETITHMIKEVKKDADGKTVGYVTFGTNTGTVDEAVVEPEFVLGKYSGKLPGVGNFFAFVKSVPGYIVCILVPFILLIMYNGVNVIRLFKKYKGEQKAEIQAERDQIAAEREQNAEMLRQLQALQAQLAAQNAAAAPTESSQTAAEPAPAEPTENADTASSEN